MVISLGATSVSQASLRVQFRETSLVVVVKTCLELGKIEVDMFV